MFRERMEGEPRPLPTRPLPIRPPPLNHARIGESSDSHDYESLPNSFDLEFLRKGPEHDYARIGPAPEPDDLSCTSPPFVPDRGEQHYYGFLGSELQVIIPCNVSQLLVPRCRQKSNPPEDRLPGLRLHLAARGQPEAPQVLHRDSEQRRRGVAVPAGEPVRRPHTPAKKEVPALPLFPSLPAVQEQ